MSRVMLICRIESVDVCGPHSLRLVFNNQVAKRVDLLPLLQGPVFEPLLDPEVFRSAFLDQLLAR